MRAIVLAVLFATPALAGEPAYIPVAANANDLVLLDVASIEPSGGMIRATFLWVYKAPRPHNGAMVSYFIDTQLYDCDAGTATPDGLNFYDEAGALLGSEPPSADAAAIKPVPGGAGEEVIKSVCGGWRTSEANPLKGTQAAIDMAREILRSPAE